MYQQTTLLANNLYLLAWMICQNKNHIIYQLKTSVICLLEFEGFLVEFTSHHATNAYVKYNPNLKWSAEPSFCITSDNVVDDMHDYEKKGLQKESCE